MEARVTRLEDDMREIKTDLKAIRADLSDLKVIKSDLADLKPLRTEVAEIKGRVSQLPTVWQINMQMIGLTFTVLGGAFVIMRYAAH